MILYNVTINVDDSIHEQWLMWMQNKHIQDVLNTGLFSRAKFVRVLVADENNSKTYAVQYFVDSRKKLETYYKDYAPALRQEGLQLFGDKMLAFRTELEVLKEFYAETN